MPNLRLSQVDVMNLIDHLASETRRLQGAASKAVALATPPAAMPKGADVVAIANAWIRESHPDADATAGYMTLVNIAAKNLTLIGIESPAFRKVEVHEMVTVNELPRMRRATPISVPIGSPTRFAPGGKHLMLMGPLQPLTAGQSVEMTLLFDGGGEQTVSITVTKDVPGMAGG
jgi:copper(I)-binding protein